MTILRTGHLGHLKIAGDKKKNTGLVLWLYTYIPNGYWKKNTQTAIRKQGLLNPREKASATLQQTKLQVFSFNSGQDRPFGDPRNCFCKEDILMVTTRSSFFGHPNHWSSKPAGCRMWGNQCVLHPPKSTQTAVGFSPFQFCSTHFVGSPP